MAHKKMILTEAGAQVYRTRMLSAGAPVTLGASDARLFEKHGWAEEPKRGRKAAAPIIPTVEEVLSAKVVEPQDDMKALRAEYRKKFKKGPGPSWDAATIREKIAEA
jgi:hypothetical protein